MAGIKKINQASPGVLRPVQVSDLQDIWDAIVESLASGTANNNAVQILSGFNIGQDKTLTSGVVSANGQLYYYDDSDASGKLSIGSMMFAGTVEDSERTLANGSVIPFYTKYKIQPAPEGLSNVFLLSDDITTETLNTWRLSFIAPESIRPYMIMSGSIGAMQLGTNAVTSEKIADGAVAPGKIAANSVEGSNVQNGTIGMVKLRGGAFVRPLNSYMLSVTTAGIFTYMLDSDSIYQFLVVGSGVLGLKFTISIGVTVFYVQNNLSKTLPVNVAFGSVIAGTAGDVPSGKRYKFTAYMCQSGEVVVDSVEVATFYAHD